MSLPSDAKQPTKRRAWSSTEHCQGEKHSLTQMLYPKCTVFASYRLPNPSSINNDSLLLPLPSEKKLPAKRHACGPMAHGNTEWTWTTNSFYLACHLVPQFSCYLIKHAETMTAAFSVALIWALKRCCQSLICWLNSVYLSKRATPVITTKLT